MESEERGRRPTIRNDKAKGDSEGDSEEDEDRGARKKAPAFHRDTQSKKEKKCTRARA